jgi:mono/diheme cytochrome c family protein
MLSRVALILLLALPAGLAGPQSAPRAQVTFSEDVAPIVFNRCASCHRPGEAAPFSLLNYDDVKKRGNLIARVTQSRYMPPWHGASEMGAFRDDRRLTDTQIRIIQDWVQAGMPEGDAAKTPQVPKFTPGWQLGQPDLVVRMNEPFEIPADGPDLFRNFAIALNLKQDQWVKAVEFRSTANASHHALFFLDQTGAAVKLDEADPRPGFGGMSFLGTSTSNGAGGRRGLGQFGLRGASGLGGWAVGGAPRALPEGLARALPQGSDLVVQMHFHPTGKIEREQATIGLYFADGPPKRSLTALQMPPVFGALAGIDIPAGEKRFVIKDSFTLPIDVEVIGGGGHAHYLATDMHMTATMPDGRKRELLGIPNWKFNWQEGYNFSEPVRLPKGTRLDVEIAYNNSSENPSNPTDPPRRVTWGQQSTDEMGAMTIEIVPIHESDLPIYTDAVREHLQNSLAGAITNLGGRRRGR